MARPRPLDLLVVLFVRFTVPIVEKNQRACQSVHCILERGVRRVVLRNALVRPVVNYGKGVDGQAGVQVRRGANVDLSTVRKPRDCPMHHVDPDKLQRGHKIARTLYRVGRRLSHRLPKFKLFSQPPRCFTHRRVVRIALTAGPTTPRSTHSVVQVSPPNERRPGLFMALKNKGMGRRVILDSNKMWCVGFVWWTISSI